MKTLVLVFVFCPFYSLVSLSSNNEYCISKVFIPDLWSFSHRLSTFVSQVHVSLKTLYCISWAACTEMMWDDEMWSGVNDAKRGLLTTVLVCLISIVVKITLGKLFWWIKIVIKKHLEYSNIPKSYSNIPKSSLSLSPSLVNTP